MRTEIETINTDFKRSAGRRPQLTGDGAANILIVDDDVDAALLVESVFARLGCKTLCSLTAADARKTISSGKADIIILDWSLDQHVDAGVIVNEVAHRLDRLGVNQQSRRRPKIVTYSSLNPSEIGLLDNSYFEHCDHWQKPIKQTRLLVEALSLLHRVGR